MPQPAVLAADSNPVQAATEQYFSGGTKNMKADLFLSEKDLKPYELEANKNVIPAKLPAKVGQ